MKKLLLLLPILVIIGAGCGSSKSDDTRPTPKEPANVTEAAPGTPAPGDAKGGGN